MLAPRKYASPYVDPRWGAMRQTAHGVAIAIHAIASKSRSAQAIWEAPTAKEVDQVKEAVVEYLRHGIITWSGAGSFRWGAHSFELNQSEVYR